MFFRTHVSGIPCVCEVLDYHIATPMKRTGTGWGDALPPEPEVFEFQIKNTKGELAPWLERKLTDEDTDRLLNEYKYRVLMEEYNALGTY